MFQNILSDDFFFNKQKFLLAYHPIVEKIISQTNMINDENTPGESTESDSKKPIMRKETRTSFMKVKPKEQKFDQRGARRSIQIDFPVKI